MDATALPGPVPRRQTDLFENWNRYYDPSVGRYLQPEPLAAEPEHLNVMAMEGHSVPTYAYALNNPVRFTDPDGRAVPLVLGGIALWKLVVGGSVIIGGGMALDYCLRAGNTRRPQPPKSLRRSFLPLPNACEMAKGGRGNKKATWIAGALQAFMARNGFRDRCDAIREMIRQSRAAGDFDEAEELKAYGKAIGCLWSSLKK